MVLKIRLARFGRAHQPIYNIVVAQSRSARNSKPIEVLGTYDPLPRTPLATHDTEDFSLSSAASESSSSTSVTPGQVQGEGEQAQAQTQTQIQPIKPKRYKDIVLDTSRTKYWLGVGAQPSEPVERLFTMVSSLIYQDS